MIGLVVDIKESTNNHMIGLKGQIIDETKNTITIKTKQNKIKKLIKNQHVFEIKKNNDYVKIGGAHLFGRSEERFKKWLRKNKKKQRM